MRHETSAGAGWIEYPINAHFAPPCDDCERERAVVTIAVRGALTDLCRRCADWYERPAPA